MMAREEYEPNYSLLQDFVGTGEEMAQTTNLSRAREEFSSALAKFATNCISRANDARNAFSLTEGEELTAPSLVAKRKERFEDLVAHEAQSLGALLGKGHDDLEAVKTHTRDSLQRTAKLFGKTSSIEGKWWEKAVDQVAKFVYGIGNLAKKCWKSIKAAYKGQDVQERKSLIKTALTVLGRGIERVAHTAALGAELVYTKLKHSARLKKGAMSAATGLLQATGRALSAVGLSTAGEAVGGLVASTKKEAGEASTARKAARQTAQKETVAKFKRRKGIS
jgi:hypothetical protein